MSEKIVLTNAEVIDKRLAIAIGKLAGQSFAYKLAWAITDIQSAVESQAKRYNKALMNLYKSHGAKENKQNGYYFDILTGDAEKDVGKVEMPEECKQQIENLNEETMEHELDLIELPLKRKDKDGKEIDVEYEPIIFIGLKKFIKRQ